jgi:mannose-6-phosphate isomerase-like protein (cupin superfamily)
VSTIGSPAEPIALGPEGEAPWFLGTLSTVDATAATTARRVAVIEHDAPRASGPPLHVHHHQDEWFHVIDGELTLWIGGRVITAPADSLVYGPRDIPHTFTVSSERARFLNVAAPAGLEKLMRALCEPATRPEIPAARTAPPDMAAMRQLAADHGIEILGPPGIPA